MRVQGFWGLGVLGFREKRVAKPFGSQGFEFRSHLRSMADCLGCIKFSELGFRSDRVSAIED